MGKFVALLPEQGQERQVVWWLFQTGNWRPALSPQWLGGDPDQGIWLLCGTNVKYPAQPLAHGKF